MSNISVKLWHFSASCPQCSLRPRASSSSSHSERSGSPLVMNNTQSLDVSARLAISAEEEGNTSFPSLLPTYCWNTCANALGPGYRGDRFQPEAYQTAKQQHWDEAVVPQRGVAPHRSPAGDPRETQVPCWERPKVGFSLWSVPHHYPR